MNLLALNLMAPVAALAAFGLVACGGEMAPAATTTAPVSDTPDPAATPTPASPIPEAPPEIPPGGVDVPHQQLDPTDPTAPPPPGPPPVLPDSPN